MKKIAFIWIFLLCAILLWGCSTRQEQPQITTTTLPIYTFTAQLCQNTDITVGQLVTEEVSCLHDYSLQTKQMRMLESAELIVMNGAGLEDFLELRPDYTICDASAGIDLLCPDSNDDHNEHSEHEHDFDPHIWLAPENAKLICRNIYQTLYQMYPQYTEVFQANLQGLISDLDDLQSYAENTLSTLTTRELITFHDGFAYFAYAFDLTILKAVEEESGSEASAAELIELIKLVEQHRLPAIFTETNGSVSAADIISAETGACVYTLDMGMGEYNYFETMYHNINTIKEALG